MKDIKAGSVNTFDSTSISSDGVSKNTGKLKTPKISNAPGFGKAKIIK